MPAGQAFGPVQDYVPHRPPMLLIDHIVDVSENQIVCRTTIHRDCAFAIDGRVHPSAMIELVAQACAIYVGVLSAHNGDPPMMGLIMGCREVAFAVDSFAVGDELTVAATRVFGQKQLAAFTGTVMRRDGGSDGPVAVSVQLSVIDAALAARHMASEDIDP